MFKAIGNDELWRGESGSHRVQQLSGIGKKQRIHTSTITIAVLAEVSEIQLIIKPNELQWKTCRSTGSGGQSVNTTDSAVQLTHIPSGMSVRCESEKSQQQNKITALALLRARLWEQQNKELTDKRAGSRKQQIGSGPIVWSVRYQDQVVIHHQSGTRIRLKDYLKGDYTVKWTKR